MLLYHSRQVLATFMSDPIRGRLCHIRQAGDLALGPDADKGHRADQKGYADFPVKASACVECGECLERCPFDVAIMAKMHEAAVVFEE